LTALFDAPYVRQQIEAICWTSFSSACYTSTHVQVRQL